MPPDLAQSSTLISSNNPFLKLIFMVPKVFQPLKFDCISFTDNSISFNMWAHYLGDCTCLYGLIQLVAFHHKLPYEWHCSHLKTIFSPQNLLNGMNKFLESLDITFRRDPNNFRPRINKLNSVKVIYFVYICKRFHVVVENKVLYTCTKEKKTQEI